MVDTRLEHLEARLTRIEAVLLISGSSLGLASRLGTADASYGTSADDRGRRCGKGARYGMGVLFLWLATHCGRTAIRGYQSCAALTRFADDTVLVARIGKAIEEAREQLKRIEEVREECGLS
jgi:hypothetical protein